MWCFNHFVDILPTLVYFTFFTFILRRIQAHKYSNLHKSDILPYTTHDIEPKDSQDWIAYKVVEKLREDKEDT